MVGVYHGRLKRKQENGPADSDPWLVITDCDACSQGIDSSIAFDSRLPDRWAR
jgi:hypothetical protein